ncbi:EFR1 family ferrodoxin [Gorillibacterium sp. CAU 1737]|uniref:EFR1 family ferrodoxin n=1 Tax=Gorillibacterium sp. CAU 1737 TaxID=3140362 RepID=UPI003260F3F7
MIFYFSGTGNSLYAAKRLATETGEELASIAAIENQGLACYEHTLKDDEIIGFVYPVYAWGPPKTVLAFIEKLKLNHYRGNYVFSVATCGGSIGNTMKVMKAGLRKQGIHLTSGYSIVMPNNYILMGDVDSKDKENAKLLRADETLKEIAQAIRRRAEGEFKLHKGALPWLLTGVMNPLFNKNAVNPAKFYAMDHCTGCGICEQVCNCQTITVQDKPQWGTRCTQCLACIHYCPEKAIQFGSGTVKKGRYTNPHIGVKEIVSCR